MTRIFEKRVRKSPILVSSLHKNWDNTGGKQKMIRMSLRKLKKIGDPETFLRRAVLINNTLETVKTVPGGPSLERSQYSLDEELILSRVILPSPALALPDPITPIADTEEDNFDYEAERERIATATTTSSQQQQQQRLGASVETGRVEDEYLLEEDRAMFNSYLSLCSSELYMENNCKSIVAAWNTVVKFQITKS